MGLSKQADIELKWKANHWQAQYERLLIRKADLKAQVAAHEAQPEPTVRPVVPVIRKTGSHYFSGPFRYPPNIRKDHRIAHYYSGQL